MENNFSLWDCIKWQLLVTALSIFVILSVLLWFMNSVYFKPSFNRLIVLKRQIYINFHFSEKIRCRDPNFRLLSYNQKIACYTRRIYYKIMLKFFELVYKFSLYIKEYYWDHELNVLVGVHISLYLSAILSAAIWYF